MHCGNFFSTKNSLAAVTAVSNDTKASFGSSRSSARLRLIQNTVLPSGLTSRMFPSDRNPGSSPRSRKFNAASFPLTNTESIGYSSPSCDNQNALTHGSCLRCKMVSTSSMVVAVRSPEMSTIIMVSLLVNCHLTASVSALGGCQCEDNCAGWGYGRHCGPLPGRRLAAKAASLCPGLSSLDLLRR